MCLCITLTSSKGGVGKTTLAANLGGYWADEGHAVLLVDADVQPALSSYYPITEQANRGLDHLIRQSSAVDGISKTDIPGLDLVYSDDPQDHLSEFILHASDGRGRLKFALDTLRDSYDFIIIDTQGARGALLQTAVLAGDLCLSPISPDIVSAREFQRGTLDMLAEMAPMARMGLPVGPLLAVLYRMDRTRDARFIADSFDSLSDESGLTLLNTVVPSLAAYKAAATDQLPVHRYEPTRRGPTDSALKTMANLASEIVEFARRELSPALTQFHQPNKNGNAVRANA